MTIKSERIQVLTLFCDECWTKFNAEKWFGRYQDLLSLARNSHGWMSTDYGDYCPKCRSLHEEVASDA